MQSPKTPLSRPLLPPAYFVTEPVSHLEAVTDAGRSVSLFHFGAYVFPIEGQQLSFRPETQGCTFLKLAEQSFLANTKQDPATLERVTEPFAECNCHGWIFTSGKFLIQDAHVLTILADNRYMAVDDAQAGDLAIYLKDELATHSGFVRQRHTGGPILVESKWGPFGVFTHAPTGHPFAGVCRFYRSPRCGHSLTIKPKAG
jgi:hypothetical protein